VQLLQCVCVTEDLGIGGERGFSSSLHGMTMLGVMVQKVCRVARNEGEVREILDAVWENPGRGGEALARGLLRGTRKCTILRGCLKKQKTSTLRAERKRRSEIISEFIFEIKIRGQQQVRSMDR